MPYFNPFLATAASSPSPSSAKDQDGDKKTDPVKDPMTWGMVRAVTLVAAIGMFLYCQNKSPDATPADIWTVLGIFFFPEFYILYKFVRLIAGKECTTASNIRARSLKMAQAQIELAALKQ